MTKTDIVIYCIAPLWGIILSVFYFGGLYYTLKLAAGSNKLKSILFISFIIRTIVVLAGFWITVKYGFYPFIISFIAFVITRFVITKKLGPGSERK